MSRLSAGSVQQDHAVRTSRDLDLSAARLRRWTVLLIGAAGLLLAVLVAIAAVLLTESGRERPTASTEPPAKPAVTPPPAKEVARPEPVVKEVKPTPAHAVIAPEVTSTPAPAIAMQAARNEQLLETLGGLSAAHLYQNYLNIGLLADGVESETYSKPDAEKMLDTVTGLMDLVDRHLTKLTESGLEAQDQKSLEKIRTLTGLLRTQATALRAYWDTGKEEQVTRYHTAREQAWTGLSEMLGVQEKEKAP